MGGKEKVLQKNDVGDSTLLPDGIPDLSSQYTVVLEEGALFNTL